MKMNIQLIASVLLYVLIFIFLHGASATDLSTSAQLFAHPLTKLPTDAQFLHSSPLLPVIGHVLQVRGETAIFIFYSVFVVLAGVALYYYISTLSKKELGMQKLLLTVVALTPLTHVLTTWVGKSDPLIITLYIAWLSTKSVIGQNSVLIALILTHREHAVFILLIHAILFRDWKKIGQGIVGILLGLTISSLYVYCLGAVESRITYIHAHHLFAFGALILAIPSLLFLWSWFWIPLLDRLRQVRADRMRLLMVLGIIFVVSIFTRDTTRTATMLSLPVYMLVLQTYAEHTPEWLIKYWPILLIISFVVVEWVLGTASTLPAFIW